MEYLSTEDAARRLGVSRNFLEKLRLTDGGPEFIRVTARCIRYRADALDSWMAERRATSTRDYGPEAA